MSKKMLMAVACLGAAAIGFGQRMETVRVNLPYDAKVGGISLPAGVYSIHELSNSVIEISSEAHKGLNAFALVTPVIAPNAADHTKVILRHNDNGYQLQRVWVEGQDVGFELNAAE